MLSIRYVAVSICHRFRYYDIQQGMPFCELEVTSIPIPCNRSKPAVFTLNCPTSQKPELVDTVIDTVKRRQNEQAR